MKASHRMSHWPEVVFFISIALLAFAPDDLQGLLRPLRFILIGTTLIGVIGLAYRWIVGIVGWLLEPDACREGAAVNDHASSWGSDWSEQQEVVRSMVLRPLWVGGRFALFSFMWLFRFLARPTFVLFYIVAVPVVGLWLIWHAIDVRLAVIETALGGREQLRCNRNQVIHDVSPSVVRIIGGEGEGSGFVFDAGYVLTNHHVIADEPSPKIVYADGSFEVGSVYATDEDRDLAIISINKRVPPLSWADGEQIATGERVLAFGFPLGGKLDGAVTVNETSVSGDRLFSTHSAPISFVQLAGGLVSGMSGGPVVNLCGKVVGVNNLGGEYALSLALDRVTARAFIQDVWLRPSDYTWDIKKIDFAPDKSPEELVRAYYNYLKVRNFSEAYGLLSKHFVGAVDYEAWVRGFEYELDTTVRDLVVDRRNPNRVFVSFTSTDFQDEQFIYRSFEGSWLVRKIDGHLRLWESNIKETTRRW